MSYIPTPEQAEELVKRYNKDAFHIQHAETVSKVMGEFAREYDPENIDFWRTVGMLHDIDFELWPEQHCVKAGELLRELDIDGDVIHAVVSHGYGICSDVEPVKYMEKMLFAVDELTGIIQAYGRLRDDGIIGMQPKGFMKRFKDKRFAAKCDRELIKDGCARLGMELRDVAEICIRGMEEHAEELGLTGKPAEE